MGCGGRWVSATLGAQSTGQRPLVCRWLWVLVRPCCEGSKSGDFVRVRPFLGKIQRDHAKVWEDLISTYLPSKNWDPLKVIVLLFL